jgi:hypothetical protein
MKRRAVAKPMLPAPPVMTQTLSASCCEFIAGPIVGSHSLRHGFAGQRLGARKLLLHRLPGQHGKREREQFHLRPGTDGAAFAALEIGREVLRDYWRNEYGFMSWARAACDGGQLHGDPKKITHAMISMMRAQLFWPAVPGRLDMQSPVFKAEMAEAVEMFLTYYGQPR